jgi:hypothetical protein
MSIPVFLASSYYYFERAGVTDVQTIINDFSAQVLANVPAWTNPTGNRFQSPVDGYGRFFDVEFTRVDQYRLTMVLRDQNAVTIMTRRINIPSANGTVVRIYTGQYHFCVDIESNAGIPECLWGGILDMTPESQNSHSRYVFGWGSRSTSDVYSNGYFEYLYMNDISGVASARRVNMYTANQAGRPRPIKDSLGYTLYYPAMVYVESINGQDMRYAGRMYHNLLVSEKAGDIGSILEVPIDAGVTGKFRILAGYADPENGVGMGYKVAIRVPD